MTTSTARVVGPSAPGDKLVDLDRASHLAEGARARGDQVVLAHGVFDLLHLGHVRHLESARREGELLMVSVTADRFVNKGPERPVFTAAMRAEMLAALGIVDHVLVSEAPTAVPVIERIRPAVYVKGVEYADARDDVTGRILDERRAVERAGGRVVYTDDATFSSSALINRHLDVHRPELRHYLAAARAAGWAESIAQAVEQVAGYRVLVVGDAIVDEYRHVTSLGKSAKETMIATRLSHRELFAGGVFAAANHVAGLCEEVEIVTCLGAAESYEDTIRESLAPNVRLTAFERPDAPTTCKTRFVEQPYLRKLFEVYHFDDRPLPQSVQARIDSAIAARIHDYDVVVVTDFGHGLMGQGTIDLVQSEARFLAVNAQTNSANHGYNLVTKYRRADYVCVDAPEARLAAGNRHGEIADVVRDGLAPRIDCGRFAVTRGDSGCTTWERGGAFHDHPAFTRTVVDSVGAGDAFLAVTAPVVASGLDLDQVGFLGNAAGALKVAIVGHRQSVEKPALLKGIKALLQ